MSNVQLAQAILDLSSNEMKTLYSLLLKQVNVNRHSNCELQFQQILAAVIDPDGPIDLQELVSFVHQPPIGKEEDSWNDKREIDAIWH